MTGTASHGDAECEPEDPEAVTNPARSIVRASLLWSLANSLSGRVLSVGIGMVLARLLTPREFGTYAIVFLVLAIAQSMNELGVSVVLLRSPTDPKALAPTAVTISIGTSAAFYAIIFVTAPAIAAALGAPSATNILRLTSLNVVLDAFSSIPNTFLSRSFRQARRTVVDLGAAIPSAVVSILLAAAGYGPMSLAWGSLAGNLTAVVLVYLLAPARPLTGWNSDHARTLLRGGLPLAATSLIYLATLNVDYVVVSRMLGIEALGFYVLAFNLSSWPSSLLSLSIRRVAIPGFAQMAHDREALQIAYVRAVRLLATIAVLLALMMSTLARPLVLLMYGETWLPAVRVLTWLAILGGMRVLFDLAYDVLVALSALRVLVKVQAFWIAGLFVALPLGARLYDIEGVGIGHIAVAMGVAIAYLLSLARAGLSVKPIVSAVVGPAVAGSVTFVLVSRLPLSHVERWPAPAAIGFLTLVVYAVLLGVQRQNRPFVHRAIGRVATLRTTG